MVICARPHRQSIWLHERRSVSCCDPRQIRCGCAVGVHPGARHPGAQGQDGHPEPHEQPRPAGAPHAAAGAAQRGQVHAAQGARRQAGQARPAGAWQHAALWVDTAAGMTASVVPATRARTCEPEHAPTGDLSLGCLCVHVSFPSKSSVSGKLPGAPAPAGLPAWMFPTTRDGPMAGWCQNGLDNSRHKG